MILRLTTPLLFGIALAAAACSGDDNKAGDDDGDDDGGSSGSSGGSSSGGTDPTVERIVCPTPIAAAPAGQLCNVTEGDADKTLIQATVLAGNTIYENGAVLVDRSGPNGKIMCVGCDCEPAGATVLACAQGVLSPGLINSHDHMPFNAPGSPKGHGEDRYNHRHDWRKGLRGHDSIPTDGSADGDAGKQFAEMRMLISGVTSLVGSGSAPGLVRNLDDSRADGDLGNGQVDYSTFPLDDNGGKLNAEGCAYGDIEDESKLKARIYLPHVAEGIDAEARNEYACLTGGAVNTIAANTSIVHGIGLTAADIADVASRGAKLVWSPRTNIDLYGQTADVLTYRRLGVNIALGTDWILSGSMNMLRELKCVDSLNKNQYDSSFTDFEIWRMATGNGAVAMGVEDRLGTIKQGYIADLALYDGSTSKDYRAVIDAGVEHVALVMRGGEPLYGDAAVIEGLVADADDKCETLDTCTRAKRVCAKGDTGNLLDAMKSDAKATYDLFYCGEPDSEPSCVPFRKDEYTGVASATDKDGDGLADAEDNCASHFNPRRPLENAQQPNFDGDAAGDSCDVCPLNEGETCQSVDPNDSDGDGVANGSDNCPQVKNEGQADGDSDGIGDVCDACPDEPNAAGAACTVTIQNIKQAVVPTGATVRVVDSLVTAVGTDGFFLLAPGGGNYAGLLAYGPSVPGKPAVGDIVTLTGTVDVFNGQIELKTLTGITVTGTAAIPQPIVVTAAELAADSTRAKELEGQLVRVENVTPSAYDAATKDTAMNAGAFAIADVLFPYAPPAIGTELDIVQGALAFGFGKNRICPRRSADLVVDDSVARAVASIAPATTTVAPGAQKSLTIELNAPAKAAGVVVNLSATPSGVVTFANASITIPEGDTSAKVVLTAVGAEGATATVSAAAAGQSPAITAAITISAVPAECLIISEYLEGAGQNKAIEIYNCGSAALDLSGYLLCQTNRNGSGAVGSTQSLPLSESLASKAVRTYCSSGNTLGAVCNVNADTVLQFNGNDSVYIVKNENGNTSCDVDDTVLDAFGHITGAVANGTPWAEHTYSRCDLAPYDGSGTTFTPTDKFKELPATTVDGLGVAPASNSTCN